MPYTIIHAEDDADTRSVVNKALRAQGYNAFELDTSDADKLRTQLAAATSGSTHPDVCILDGHNILRDSEGNQLYDMTPLGMVSWLREHGVPRTCKLILFSNDEKLISQVRTNHFYQINEAVPKGGSDGGLRILLAAVKRVLAG